MDAQERNTSLYDFSDPMEQERLVRTIDQFVPWQLLEFLGKRTILEAQPGDHTERELTILFMDIRDFTTLSESLSPEENFDFINSWLGLMEPIINAHRGIIDKFIGDAVMALFRNPDDALDCSLLMVRELGRYNEGRARAGYQPINIGIGINTGIAMIGTLGGASRMESTVISDAVNVASRVEGTTKQYRVHILLSEHSYRCLSDSRKYHIRFLDRLLLKGKTRPLSVYEVYDSDPPGLCAAKDASMAEFADALAHYHLLDVPRAREMLRQIVDAQPGDHPARTYLERCELYLGTGSHQSIREVFQQLEWTSDNILGLEDIDNQHYRLYLHSLKLMDMVRTGAQRAETDEIMSFLETYVVEHFQREEDYMAECRYPFSDSHKREHQRFIDRFHRLRDELAEARLGKTYLMFQIQIFLIDWLLTHTCKTDRHFGNFYRKFRDRPSAAP